MKEQLCPVCDLPLRKCPSCGTLFHGNKKPHLVYAFCSPDCMTNFFRLVRDAMTLGRIADAAFKNTAAAEPTESRSESTDGGFLLSSKFATSLLDKANELREDKKSDQLFGRNIIFIGDKKDGKK